MADLHPQTDLKRALTERLLAAGFDAVGFAAPDGVDHARARKFTAAAASPDYEVMGWLARTADKRIDPLLHTPWAKSVVMVAAAYGCGEPHDEPNMFARYASLPDYHDWVGERLEPVTTWLHDRMPRSQHEIMVDSGPIAEKLFASAAGLGWIGRNTLVINPEFGSYVVFGTLITSIEFEPDQPRYGSCRLCRRCIDACPTGALRFDGGLKPSRCLSWLTVEAKQREVLLETTGEPIFGCDICQDVCPYNVGVECGAYGREEQITAPIRSEYIGMTNLEFWKRFEGYAVARGVNRGWRGFKP